MHEYCVYELMTQEVVTCSPNEPLLEAVKTLSSKVFSCIVVVEEDIPVGIITERDLVEVLVDTLEGVTWEELDIKHFMTSPIVTITEDMTLYEAVTIARENTIRHIPVVGLEGKLVGLLTQTDIVNGYYDSQDV